MDRPAEPNSIDRELLEEAIDLVDFQASLLDRSKKLLPTMRRTLTALLKRCSDDPVDIVIYQTLTNLRESIGIRESTLRYAIKKAGIARSGRHGQSYGPDDVYRIYEVRRRTCLRDERLRWETMLSMLRFFPPQPSLPRGRGYRRV